MDRITKSKLAQDPVFLRVMADALSIQDRFSAEPVYARTGKGSLKSAGVTELARIKSKKTRKVS
jgi:hypothetical protein